MVNVLSYCITKGQEISSAFFVYLMQNKRSFLSFFSVNFCCVAIGKVKYSYSLSEISKHDLKQEVNKQQKHFCDGEAVVLWC